MRSTHSVQHVHVSTVTYAPTARIPNKCVTTYNHIVALVAMEIIPYTAQCDTSFMTALFKQDLDCAKLLINEGASVNSLCIVRGTPLTLLCSSTDIPYASVKMLLEHGAHANLIDPSGQSPLICAISEKRIDVVTLLVAHGAEVNMPNKLGMYPLHCCVSYNASDCMTYILEQGVDTIARNIAGETALVLAAKIGCESYNPEMSMILTEKTADINIPSHSGFTALMSTASDSAHEEFDTLIQRGANINMIDSNGYSAILYAYTGANVYAAERLIGLGCMRTTDHASGLSSLPHNHMATVGWQLDTRHATKRCRTLNELFFGSGEAIDPSLVRTQHAIMQTSLTTHKDATLLGMCRHRIRTYLKETHKMNLIKQVDALPLPLLLKRYLTFQAE